MNNFDDIFVDQKTGETANNKDFVPFNKDEWAARKQQERADAYALIDRAAEDAAKDGGVFQGYLDVQSRFDRYSVGNALLITIQMPEATRLADYNGWKDNNVYVKKGATGITILEPGDEYTREDGSVGVWYNAKKVFDISQTNSRQQAAPAVSHDPRLLLKALINNAPCKISISENLPENVYAAYQPQDKVILIRQGMDAPDIFRALSQELAHAHIGANTTAQTAPLPPTAFPICCASATASRWIPSVLTVCPKPSRRWTRRVFAPSLEKSAMWQTRFRGIWLLCWSSAKPPAAMMARDKEKEVFLCAMKRRSSRWTISTTA